MIQNSFRRIVGGVLDPYSVEELQLPIQFSLLGKQSFDIVLTSAIIISPFYFLLSISSYQQRVSVIIYTACVLSTDSHLRIAHEQSSQQVEIEDDISWHMHIFGNSRLCKTFAHSVYKNIQRNMGGGDIRTVHNALKIPRPKDWLRCKPCPLFRMHISNWYSKVWIQFYFGFLSSLLALHVPAADFHIIRMYTVTNFCIMLADRIVTKFGSTTSRYFF